MEKNKKIMDIQSLIFTVATLFLLLIAGIIAGKLKIVDEIASKKLSRLILTIGQPMLIISSVLTASYTHERFIIALKAMVVCFIAHAMMAVVAFFAAKPVKGFDEKNLLSRNDFRQYQHDFLL